MNFYLKSWIIGKEAQLCKGPPNLLNLQANQAKWDETNSLSLSQGRLSLRNELMKCVCMSVMRLKDDSSSGPLKWH